MPKPLSIVAVSTVLPRPCGIATFNQDVMQALQPFDVEIVSIAMQRGKTKYAYPTSTIATIRQKKKSDYAKIADLLNKRQPDVILLQHEFGIYGGKHGVYVLELLRRLKVPVVVVMHRYEIIQNTDEKRERVLLAHDIARYARAVIVISKIAQEKLSADLLASGITTPVIHIPHGTPAVADYILANPKQEVLGEDVPTLATFGLISKRKGIRDVIEVMPDIIQQHPSVVFRVLGRPHPADSSAQTFLRQLKEQVKQLGLERQVQFVTEFLSVKDIMENLQATDIYVTFYADPDQTSSGTLAFALAAGCCVVSTPYIHARELLAGDRGILIPFQDRAALKDTIITLLSDRKKIAEYRKRALRFGRKTAWSLVGEQYAATLRNISRGKKIS